MTTVEDLCADFVTTKTVWRRPYRSAFGEDDMNLARLRSAFRSACRLEGLFKPEVKDFAAARQTYRRPYAPM
jgi:hypothetical protein